MYEKGQGVDRSDVEAVQWHLKAAEQGNSKAQAVLGGLYAERQGVTPDYVEAARGWQKAADQGRATAQFNLGIIYYDSHSVAKSFTEAARFHRNATDKGSLRRNTIWACAYHRTRSSEGCGYFSSLPYTRSGTKHTKKQKRP
jgi:hypothetical protein